MTELVPSGIDEIGLQPGSHICAFYRGDDARDRLLSSYLSAGLSAGDKCICILDSDRTASRLSSRLPSGAPDGQIDLHPPETTYLAGGSFTTSRMLQFWSDSIDQAEREGYLFCRLAGEMTWALRDAPGVDQLASYELELNRVTASSPVIVLCLYDLDLFGGEVVVSIVKTHPQVLVQGILVENPYYLGPGHLAG